MPAIRSLDSIKSKWATVTPQRAADFEAGIRAPKKDWAAQTAAAEEAYESGVTAAIADKRFGRGVKEAGTAKWQERALAVGVTRWPQGVRAAEDNYAKGFAPYHDVIARTNLPPRFGRGDPRNIERVATLASALHKARVSGSR